MNEPWYDPWDDIDNALDLKMAINNLAPDRKRVVMLWLLGYTHADISLILEISERAVRYRLRAAKNEISLFLK